MLADPNPSAALAAYERNHAAERIAIRDVEIHNNPLRCVYGEPSSSPGRPHAIMVAQPFVRCLAEQGNALGNASGLGCRRNLTRPSTRLMFACVRNGELVVPVPGHVTIGVQIMTHLLMTKRWS